MPSPVTPPLYAPAGGLHLRGRFYQGGEQLDVKGGDSERQALVEAGAHSDRGRAQADFRNKPAFGKGELKPTRKQVESRRAKGLKDREELPVVGADERPHDAPAPEPYLVGVPRGKITPDRLPPKVGEHLTDDEARKLSARSARQLVQAVNSRPPDEDYVQAALAGQAKRGWYRRSRRAIQGLMGGEAPRFTAILAGTSPNTSPRDNLNEALLIWEKYLRVMEDRKARGLGGLSYKEAQNLVQQWFAESVALKKSGDTTPRLTPFPSKANAIAKALSATDFGDQGHAGFFGPTAQKIDSFFRNLLGFSHPTTNDLWEARLSDVDEKAFASLHGYLADTVKNRRAAAIINRRFGLKGKDAWTPMEVQECSWSFVRGLAMVGARSRDNPDTESNRGTAFEGLQGRPLTGRQSLDKLTHQMIRESGDFMTLLASDEKARATLDRIDKRFPGLRLGEAFNRTLRAYQESLRRERTKSPPLTGPVIPSDLPEPQRSALERVADRAGAAVPSFQGPKGRQRYARHLIDVKGSSGHNGSMTRKKLAAPPVQRMPVPAPSPAGNPLTGQEGQDRPSRADYHVGAVSPGTEFDLTFPEALARTQSSNHVAFKKIIEGVSHQLGIQGNTRSAVGDWEDGAENSVLQTIPHPANPEVVRYAAAWYGLLGNQRAVLTFHPDPKGPDSFYQIDLKGVTDVGQVRDQLSQAGVPFRTLVPGRKGTRVMIYDEGRQWRDRVAQFASAHNAVVRESHGQGSYIGGPTRAAARAKYRAVITAYEAAHAPAGGGSLSAVREATLGHSVGGAANRAEAKGKLQAAGPRVRLSGVNAPAGGVIVRGQFYPGGHFIPSAQLEKASWDQYQTVEGRRAKVKMHKRGDGSYSLAPVLDPAPRAPQKLAKVFHARDLIPTDPEPKKAPEAPEVRPSRTPLPRGPRSRVEVPADKAKVAQAREAARSRPADPLAQETTMFRGEIAPTAHPTETQRPGITQPLPTFVNPQQARQYISRLYNVARDFDSDVEAGTTGMTAYEQLLRRHALWYDILRAEAEYRERGRPNRYPLPQYTPEEQRQIIQRRHDNRAIYELASHGLIDYPEGAREGKFLEVMHRVHNQGYTENGRLAVHPLSDLADRIHDQNRQGQVFGQPGFSAARDTDNQLYARLGKPAWDLIHGRTAPADVDETIQAIRDYGIPLNPERARRVWAEARALREQNP